MTFNICMIPLEYKGSIIVAILVMNKASISHIFYSITFYVIHDKVFTTACDGCFNGPQQSIYNTWIGNQTWAWTPSIMGALTKQWWASHPMNSNSRSIPEKIELVNLFQSATTTDTYYCTPWPRIFFLPWDFFMFFLTQNVHNIIQLLLAVPF